MLEEDFLKLLGKRIVELRTSKGLKQVELANRIGLEDSSLRRIETGRVNSTIGMLKKICEGLNITLTELLDFKY